MEHTHVEITDLVGRIDRKEVRLPEIQRAYVWKPAQIAGLLDSLYRGYPSGSMLLWRPGEAVREREASLDATDLKPMATAQYLLDGQQRLTSLHRVFHRHPDAEVVFNVITPRFQVQSAATKKDARWVRVADLLHHEKPSQIRRTVIAALPGLDLDEDEIDGRIAQVRAIAKYKYYLEIITDLPYEEVTQIFVRVNSRGRALKTVDLALATLSARWPGVVAKVEAEAYDCAKRGWPRMDATFLVRSLAAAVTPTAMLAQLREPSPSELEDGWKRVRFGVDFLIRLLKENAQIQSSALIPSMNALVPLVVLLGQYGKQQEFRDADALVSWLLSVFVTGRFSAAADTKIAADSLAVRGNEPVRALFGNAGMMGTRVSVSEQQLIGKGAGSPFFLLSYLVAKGRHAKDWWHDVEISETTGAGGFSIEYHHIHPRTTLSDLYAKGEINDLANLAFISATANKKISGRSPQAYFPELLDLATGRDELTPHLVPLDDVTRAAPRYREFLAARRRLLAAAMNEFLDRIRPQWVSDESPATLEDERTVSLTHVDGARPAMRFETRLGADEHSVSVELAELERFLRDIDDGLATSLSIGGGTAVHSPEDEDVMLPVGPFELTGSPGEWQLVLAREAADVRSASTASVVSDSITFDGERVPFAISDSD